MSRQVRWLLIVLAFAAGVSLGFGASAMIPHVGLVATYERVGGWTLLGRLTVALLLLAVPVGYIVWLVAAAVRYTQHRERTRSEIPLHYLERGKQATVQHVLVSVGGGPHAPFGLHLAASIARIGDGSVTLFRVIPPGEGADDEDETQALDQMAKSVIGRDVVVATRVSRNASVVEAIVDESRQGGYDLVIVGASDERTVTSLLFGSIPEAVVERTSCPVLVVRAPEL